MFLINGLDVKPLHHGNSIDKYANDTYLLIPAGNDSTVESELQAVETWALNNNLKLNKSKSMEMIIFPSVRAKARANPIPPIPGIERVDSMKILGITLSSTLSMTTHVKDVTQTASQSLYAIKLLKKHGLNIASTLSVFNALVISRLTYASSAWWGFASPDEKKILQSTISRGIKWVFYRKTDPTLEQICQKKDNKLFSSVLSNPHHVLYHLLPPTKPQIYNTRPRMHNRVLPSKEYPLTVKNFLVRMLYSSV